MMQIVSQKDKRWCDITLGKSSSTIYYYGCTTGCISMLSDWYGCFKDPGYLAKHLGYQYDLILWQTIKDVLCFKFIWRQYWHNPQKIKASLDGKTTSCILQVNGGHWVVAIRQEPNRYYVVDPWTATRRYYNRSAVTGSAHFDK